MRSGFVEGRHQGAVVVLDAAGEVLAAAGPVAEPMFPRSGNKPLQVVGMLRAGLRLGGPDLALAASSHSGEPIHTDRVRAVLAAGGLSEADLGCPAELPLGEDALHGVLAAGGGPERITMNCSGKHAAMLRTCLAAGWPTAGYLAAEHPLQVALRAAVEELAAEPVVHAGVDGCGAPVFALTPIGLARAFSRLVDAPAGTAERAVADGMRAHPGLVGGAGRDVTRLMAGAPDVLAKDGAEGVYAAAVPGVGAVALKLADGAARARMPVLVSGLRRLGVTAEVLDVLAEVPLLGGGAPVGAVRAIW
ncbi:MAG TPA: asparaginase [Mycobacteriales bacterium]|nr:asparaginase [Mycobacteriales bacterium]